MAGGAVASLSLSYNTISGRTHEMRSPTSAVQRESPGPVARWPGIITLLIIDLGEYALMNSGSSPFPQDRLRQYLPVTTDPATVSVQAL